MFTQVHITIIAHLFAHGNRQFYSNYEHKLYSAGGSSRTRPGSRLFTYMEIGRGPIHGFGQKREQGPLVEAHDIRDDYLKSESEDTVAYNSDDASAPELVTDTSAAALNAAGSAFICHMFFSPFP